jgi:hypothetical protein
MLESSQGYGIYVYADPSRGSKGQASRLRVVAAQAKLATEEKRTMQGGCSHVRKHVFVLVAHLG